MSVQQIVSEPEETKVEQDDSSVQVRVTDSQLVVDPEARPAVFQSTLAECTCIFMLAFANIMNAANQGALSILLPRVANSYHINGSQLSWTVTSYSLVSGSTILLMARISDIVGRKRTLLWAFGWYALMSLIQGFMKNNIAFDVLRGLQAIGGAAAPSSAVAIIGILYPPSQRKNKAMATFGAGAPLGFVSGLLIGGICGEFIGWKAALFFLAIVYAVVTVVGVYVIPSDEVCFEIANKLTIAAGGTDIVPTKRHWKTILTMLKELDFVGAGLSIVGLTLFVFAISDSSGAPGGWGTSYIIALLVVGLCIVGLFLVWESRCKNPLMPLFIWKYPGFALCMATIFCGWLNFVGVLSYFQSLSFQNIRKYSTILTVAATLPMAIVGVLVNIFAAYTMHLISGRVLMIIAMLSFLAATLLWATQPFGVSYWAMPFPALCTCVIGADLAYNVGNQFSLSVVPPHMKASAAGIFNVVSQLAGTIGTAAATAIVTAKIGTDIDNQAPRILHKGYSYAFWLGVAVGGVGVIGSLFMKVGTQGGKEATDKPADLETGRSSAVIDNDSGRTSAEKVSPVE